MITTWLVLALATSQGPAQWRPLWNNRDLQGWHADFGKTTMDTSEVFSVAKVDGRPALRVSGEVIGGLTSDADLGNYQLHLEFKWGKDRHGPRATQPRDSGLLYHATGSPSKATGWYESVEFGILEGGETGDFWSVPGAEGARIRVDVEGDELPTSARHYLDQPIQYRRGGRLWPDGKAAVLSPRDFENAQGAWNSIDLYVWGPHSVHVVNGKVAMALGNIHQEDNGRRIPLSHGHVQLQSEYAEVYFRDIRVRPLAALPKDLAAALPAQAVPNTTTATERAEGWRLLFDGKSTRGFRAVQDKAPVPGWRVDRDALIAAPGAGDLMTIGRYDDFELSADWRVPVGGNSGIYYCVDPAARPLSMTAPEYEIRDNDFWPDDPYKAGGLYGLVAPASSPARPPGEWNRARIVVRGDRIEHWLNESLLVNQQRGTDAWRAVVAGSKFKNSPAFARTGSGHILLQEHGSEVRFRNIKVRHLPTPTP